MFTRSYGAGPVHLLVVLGCFALTAVSVDLLAAEPKTGLVLVWFAAAVVAHDAALFPLYSLADRALTAATRGGRRALNHVRMPLLASGLLLLLFFPGIVRQGTATHLAATGQDQQPYLGRWLLLSAAFAGISALVYGIRLLLGRSGEEQRCAS